MGEEETTEEEATTVVNPQQIQSLITAGMNYLKLTTSTYPQMVKGHGTDWTTWPQNTNWYKALHSFKLAHDQAILCVYSDFGVSAYNESP